MDRTTARMIDANFNRAREALRVMEDYARLVLDDGALTEAAKATRHDLSACLTPHVQRLLLASRDIVGDVGREVTAAGEFARGNLAEVATAAGKRLSEALRVIEECAKTSDAALAVDTATPRQGLASAIERIRYRAYELERRLEVVGAARARLAGLRLYVLLTAELCRRDWFETAEDVLRAGAGAIQLREKHLCDRELLQRARRLATLCHRNDALCVVNDRADVAAAAGADGVHLGQEDIDVAAARRVLPTFAVVGVSAHTLEQVRRAVEQCPDYLAVGPMFPSVTKPQAYVPGPALLAQARAVTGLPLVAIGGIDAGRVAEVGRAGRCVVCVCSAVIARDDPGQAVAELLERLAHGETMNASA